MKNLKKWIACVFVAIITCFFAGSLAGCGENKMSLSTVIEALSQAETALTPAPENTPLSDIEQSEYVALDIADPYGEGASIRRMVKMLKNIFSIDGFTASTNEVFMCNINNIDGMGNNAYIKIELNILSETEFVCNFALFASDIAEEPFQSMFTKVNYDAKEDVLNSFIVERYEVSAGFYSYVKYDGQGLNRLKYDSTHIATLKDAHLVLVAELTNKQLTKQTTIDATNEYMDAVSDIMG